VRKILITGGADFIGSQIFGAMTDAFPSYRLVVLDKMTYAGDIAYIADLIAIRRVQLIVG
jgi:dTDP-glucose 4,6-dehydratase